MEFKNKEEYSRFIASKHKKSENKIEMSLLKIEEERAYLQESPVSNSISKQNSDVKRIHAEK
jgi:hypothetical protein